MDGVYKHILDEKVDDKFSSILGTQATVNKDLSINEDLDIGRGKEEEDLSDDGLIQDDEEVKIAQFLRNYEAAVGNVLTQNLEVIMKYMGQSGFYFRGPAVINQIKKVTADKLDEITREFYSQVKSQGGNEEDELEESVVGIKEMKLFLLSRADADYDENEAKLVRADNEQEAREIANVDVGREGQIWTDNTKVKAEIITDAGKAGVLLADFNRG